MSHEARQAPAWLIFDVGQSNMHDRIKHPTILAHYHRCRTTTNNLVFRAHAMMQIVDKQYLLTPEVRDVWKVPDYMMSMHDIQVAQGGYGRFIELAIVSLCSDIEGFFAAMAQELTPGRSFPKSFFQKIERVAEEVFLPAGIDLRASADFSTVVMGFQIRHIIIHNMSHVDAAFVARTGSALPVGSRLSLEQEDFRRHVDGYYGMLLFIDEKRRA